MVIKPKYKLDHVHLLVANRDESAAWFERVLGFEKVEESEDPYGPLTVSGDGGTTGLALFTSKVAPDPNRVVAFRVDGKEFEAFANRVADLRLTSANGEIVRVTDVVDHGDVLSFYFTDPEGNAFELTTYDVESARQGIRELIAETMMRP